MVISNMNLSAMIINKFIKDHPELNLTPDQIYRKIDANIISYELSINDYLDYISDWRDRKGFKTDKTNIPEKLLLIHSEISEACEANRKGDEIGFQEELADTFIRLMDLTSALGYSMNSIIRVKMACNEFRPKKHGKRY